MVKSKYGYGFERQVARAIREYGRAIRIAASGAGGVGSPDVVFGIDGHAFAVECKYTSNTAYRLPRVDHEEFVKTAKILGMTPIYLAKYKSKGTFLYQPTDIKYNPKSVTLDIKNGIKVDIRDKSWTVLIRRHEYETDQ